MERWNNGITERAPCRRVTQQARHREELRVGRRAVQRRPTVVILRVQINPAHHEQLQHAHVPLLRRLPQEFVHHPRLDGAARGAHSLHEQRVTGFDSLSQGREPPSVRGVGVRAELQGRPITLVYLSRSSNHIRVFESFVQSHSCIRSRS